MRSLIVGLLGAMLACAPAVAQTPCKTTNTVDGNPSTVSGQLINGTSLIYLLTENGPFPGKLTMDPAAKGYQPLSAKEPTLTVFRVGESLAGKDWSQPGSVETIDGGFAVEWRGFALKGARVRKLAYDFSIQFLKKRETLELPKTFSDSEAFLFRIEGRLLEPRRANTASLNYNEMNAWRAAVIARYPLKIDIFDEAAGVRIATIDFVWPNDAATQTRLVSDVNALRKAVADGACK